MRCRRFAVGADPCRLWREGRSWACGNAGRVGWADGVEQAAWPEVGQAASADQGISVRTTAQVLFGRFRILMDIDGSRQARRCSATERIAGAPALVRYLGNWKGWIDRERTWSTQLGIGRLPDRFAIRRFIGTPGQEMRVGIDWCTDMNRTFNRAGRIAGSLQLRTGSDRFDQPAAFPGLPSGSRSGQPAPTERL